MTRKRVLITGFIGMRPAVFYSTIVPHLDEIQADAGVNVLPVATSGNMGSEVYCQSLKILQPLTKLSWLSPLLFERADYKKVIAQIKATCRDYDLVYLVLKGGVGSWVEEMLIDFRADDSLPEMSMIISDGKSTIITNKSGREISRKPLASLGLANYLKLCRLQINSSDCTPSGETLCGILSSPDNPQNLRLPYLCLMERSGFLYGAFDADKWLIDETSSYCKDFRKHLAVCGRIGIEKGRVLLVCSDRTKADSVKQRAIESGISIYNIGALTEENGLKLIPELNKLAREATPGGFFEGSIEEDLKPLCSPKKLDYGCDVLCMAISAVGSFVNLIAIASHRPKNLILLYDANTKSTVIAASRLHEALVKRSSTLPFKQAEFIGVDHLCLNLKETLAAKRVQYKGSWCFNLTPGTKEQAINCIFAGRAEDSFWVMDQRGGKIVELTGGGQIDQVYPHLAQIARYMGGRLKEQGYLMGNVSKEALSAVKRVFSHLDEIKNQVSLAKKSNAHQKPVIETRGVLELRATKERFNLLTLFPKFNFFGNTRKTYNYNIWLEVFVGVSLFAAGADGVVLNLKWQWQHNRVVGFRDELDVVARFGKVIVVVSCKTNINTGEAKKKNFWEIDYIARHFFGSFARPFLAVPVYVHPGSETPYGRNNKNNQDGCPTKILGANHMAHPETLQEYLLRG